MSELVKARLDQIDPNPFRLLDTYSFNEQRIEALIRSMQDVGMWEGVIARRAGDRFQLAFGHHRIEAAQRSGCEEVTLIVKPLTDEEMIGYFGRENLEDYNADFMVMLGAWEAALEFSRREFADARLQIDKDIVIARLLGWTSKNGETRDQMTVTARACASAHALIAGSYVARSDLVGLSVSDARDVCGRGKNQMDQLEALGKHSGRSNKDIEDAKKHVGKAVKWTADEIRGGEIKKSEIRGRVDLNAYRFATEAKKRTPLFSAFVKTLIAQIDSWNAKDTAKCLAGIILSLQSHLRALRKTHRIDILRFISFRRRLRPIYMRVSR